MRVRDLIAELQKLDPELPVVHIAGSDDDVYAVAVLCEIWIDDADNPVDYNSTQHPHYPIKAIQV